eukprot:scaffold80002_cov51-Phaeocystis_antarctica.AAC.1
MTQANGWELPYCVRPRDRSVRVSPAACKPSSRGRHGERVEGGYGTSAFSRLVTQGKRLGIAVLPKTPVTEAFYSARRLAQAEVARGSLVTPWAAASRSSRRPPGPAPFASRAPPSARWRAPPSSGAASRGCEACRPRRTRAEGPSRRSRSAGRRAS